MRIYKDISRVQYEITDEVQLHRSTRVGRSMRIAPLTAANYKLVLIEDVCPGANLHREFSKTEASQHLKVFLCTMDCEGA